MIGQLLGHYRVLEKIGAGGMGEVYRAHDERLGRDVAIKLIRPASSDNPDHLRRFEHEARAAASLNHPNILAIYDVGFSGKIPYIVSELLEGETIRQKLTHGPIPLRDTIEYSRQIVHGLSAAHDRGIVHRDLKPENLFLTTDGRVKILDFGVAKLQAPLDENRSIESLTTVTKHGAVIGTVAYTSPEQLRGKTVDHRSDIFSFGAILYELMTGNRAFRGETDVDTMTAVLREEPPTVNLDEAAIPPGYQDIIKHCLEKEPENRFQSAKDLVFALETLSGSSTTKTLPSFRSASRRRRWLPWALVALLALATAGFSLAQLLRSAPLRPTYERLTFEAGTIYSARFTPNGQSIVYSAAWNDKPVQLFSTVPPSTLSQALSLNDASLLAVSRNSELALVLGGTRNTQLETANAMLGRAPLAGGSPREVLADVRWADWDPNGELAVVHSVEGHSRLEYPIGKVLYQANGWISNIRFSPHGDKIAFMDHPAIWDDRGKVSVIDVQSGHEESLTTEWASERGLAWRPDGKEIWFSAADTGTTLSLMAVDLSGKRRQVLDLPMGITLEDIAPDGRVIVTLTTTRMALAYTTLGSKENTELSWHDWNVAKDISRDGQSVLFEDSSEAAGAGYAVVLRKLGGPLPIRLGTGSAGGLSPDGKWAIAFSKGPPEKLRLLPTGPGQPQPIDTTGLDHIDNGMIAFLPDGKHITANGTLQGQGTRCYVISLDGEKPKPVTPDGEVCGPSSPDGAWVIGIKSGVPKAAYPVAGGEPRPFHGLDPSFHAIQWSENGQYLFGYNVGEFPSKVYKVDIATGRQTALQELRPGASAGIVMVAPVVSSRDGRHFLYSYTEHLSVLFVVKGLL